MWLEELIAVLEKADPDQVLPIGFDGPHSYRGDYAELALEPARDVSVRSMLACAKEALGRTYTGWKGGEFKMADCTDVFLAYRGFTGEGIGPLLLGYMLGRPEFPEEER